MLTKLIYAVLIVTFKAVKRVEPRVLYNASRYKKIRYSSHSTKYPHTLNACCSSSLNNRP
jgi:hypothetical protein